jgi:hypothetical protein
VEINMKDFRKRALLLILVCVAVTTSVSAQSTAQISGTVKDPTGAVLPGVEVTATQTETGITRTTISNETGAYALPNLPLGPYKLEAALAGFRTFAQTGIVLQVSSSPVLNITLEVGQRSEQVEVQANAALVETRTVGVGQTMETQRILDLPLNGRNAAELVLTVGTAVNIPEYSSQPRSMQGQLSIAVAGGLPSGVNYALDGAQHNNPYDNLSLPLPFPDALQEFKVETSALSASQGQHSGAQVNSVTKSGTNDFHGSLFEFVRNDLLNATTYFARVDPRTGNKVHSTLKRNQFGGTVGGPIVRNKLFFFGGYQGTTNHQDPANVQNFIPTAAMLQGDFTAITSPACNNGRQLTLNPAQGFVNNRIDPTKFDPVAVSLVKKFPTTNDPCGLITYGDPANTNTKQWVGKTDYQLNAAHSIMGRILLTGEDQPVPFSLAPNNLLTTFDRGRSNFAQSYAVGDTWLVSTQTVVSTRLVANYTNIQRLGAEFFNWGDAGVKNYFSYQPKYLQLTVSNPGFQLGGGTANTSTYRTFSSGLNSDASLTRGAHQLAIGGALLWIDSNSNANVNSSGAFTVGGQFSGLGLADFLLGKASTFVQAAPNVAYVRKWYMAGYVADTWKVNQRWTLNYGLRWEPDLAETLTQGYVARYSEQARAAGVRSTVFQKAPLGFSFPGDPGFQGKRGRDRNFGEFAPRFGFAWDVRGDGKTSVRASTGIGYDYPNAQYHLWTSIIPPFGSSTTIVNPVLDDPWSTPGAGYNGTNPFPVQFGPTIPFVPFGNFTVMTNIKPAQIQSWNLSIQRQIGTDWLISASYLGDHIIHMLGSEQLNPAIYFPGNADANGNCFVQGYSLRTTAGAVCSTTANTNLRRVLSLTDFQNTGQNVANLVPIQSGGKSSYNGMLLEVRKRAGKGVTLDGNYTWSHCIAPFQSNEGGDTGANPSTPNPYVGNRDGGRGNCLSDRRQVLHFTPVLEMPNFQTPILRRVASGWRLSTIYGYSTGQFVNITATGGNDFPRNGTNTNNQLAQYVGGDRVGDHSGRPLSFWFNRSAFASPGLGTVGNSGTRAVAMPGHFDFNMALARTFQLKESQRVEFRWEVYNVTNSFRPILWANGTASTAYNTCLTCVSTELTNPLFGQLRVSDDPRIMQFAVKYLF